MRFLLVFALMAGVSSLEGADLLRQVKQHAIEDLARVPNYVCVDSVERSLWIPGEGQFRRLDRIHLELTHVEGADRFSWLGNSAFQSRNPTEVVGYGASFGGDFADNRALIFKNERTKISAAGRTTLNDRPALRFEYENPRGALAVTNAHQSGVTPARGSFWIDPETLDLLQIDIEGYAIPSKLALRAITDVTVYWRVLIGKRIVLLPHSAEFRLTDADGTVRRNGSVFSNCREYLADSTLTFGPSPTPEPPPPARDNAHIEPGLQLQLVLDRALDANQAATGDPIRAHTLTAAGSIPRGARVYGRVDRIVNFNDQIPLPGPPNPPPLPKHEVWGRHPGEVLIQIEFSAIEYHRSQQPFIARLIDLESPPGKTSTKIRGFGYLEDDAVVRYDPPGVASIYLSKENPVLRREFIMRWVTTSGRGSR